MTKNGPRTRWYSVCASRPGVRKNPKGDNFDRSLFSRNYLRETSKPLGSLPSGFVFRSLSQHDDDSNKTKKIGIFKKWNTTFARFARAIFIFVRPFDYVKWSVLPLWGRRERFTTKWSPFLNVYFDVTFSLPWLLKLPFKKRRRERQRRRHNNLIGWMRKNNRAARAARLLVQFFHVVCQMTTWNSHIWMFWPQRKPAAQNLSFSAFTWELFVRSKRKYTSFILYKVSNKV